MSKYNNLFAYMGSKITMLPYLINNDVLPQKGDVLVEPFMGSCSLLLNTDYNKYYMNDANKYIYDFAKILLTIDLVKLEENYNLLCDKFTYDGTEEEKIKQAKEFYYKVKKLYFDNYDKLDDIKKASLFCFLMYNGFSGKPMNEKITVGVIDRKKPLRMEVYKAYQAKKDKIILANLDYKEFIIQVLRYEKEEDLVVYLDPPYIESFKYEKDNKVDEFVKDILEFYKDYDFLITIKSNYNHKDIQRLYKDYKIIEVDRKLSVQTVEDKDKIKTEVIIVKDERYHPTREFELNILINYLISKDYDEKIIKHYKREMKNV